MLRTRDPANSDVTTPCLHQELFRISKENCDFKVTAGPSTSNDDKGSSGGDSGGSSPPSSSPRGAPPRKSAQGE